VGLADDLYGASLLDSATHSTRWDGLQFVPFALLSPDGWSDSLPPELHHGVLADGVQLDRSNPLEGHKALWVRARMPEALGFAPPTGRHAVRSQFFDYDRLAVSFEAGGPCRLRSTGSRSRTAYRS
jgi:hypothetical protein